MTEKPHEALAQEPNGASANERTGETPPLTVALWIVIFAINLVLLVGLIPESLLENRLVAFGKVLVPPIAGGLLLTYFEKARDLLIQFSRRQPFRYAMGGLCIALATVHLVRQLPIFSIRVEPFPSVGLLYEVDAEPVHFRHIEGQDHVVFSDLALRAQRLTVKHWTPDKTFEATVTLRPSDILAGTLDRLPLLGWLVESEPLVLSAVYDVRVVTEHGDAWLKVYGDFPELFLRDVPHYRDGRRTYLWFDIPSQAATYLVQLPPGGYDFVLERMDGCRKRLSAKVDPIPDVRVRFEQVSCEA